jgi:hypothetical protein
MTPPALDPGLQSNARHGNRRHSPDQDTLVLDEIDPELAIDRGGHGDGVVELLTFGSVREPCPKCQAAQLKLVLRQRTVRRAHLFCAGCGSCFDAHYRDGASALTI